MRGSAESKRVLHTQGRQSVRDDSSYIQLHRRPGAVRTLNLDEAAAFLQMHPEEVRQRTKHGLIPGGKAGRRWVFLEADLADYVRSLYPVRRQALQVTTSQEGLCHLSSAKIGRAHV